jgi:hypothetical protein
MLAERPGGHKSLPGAFRVFLAEFWQVARAIRKGRRGKRWVVEVEGRRWYSGLCATAV